MNKAIAAARYRAVVARQLGKNLEASVHDAEALRLEEAAAAEQKCRRCGRALTDPVSIERGIGPECAARYRLGTEP